MERKQKWLIGIGIGVAAAVLVAVFRRPLWKVLLLLLGASVQAYLYFPLVKRLEAKMNRTVAILTVYGVVLLVLTLSLLWLIPTLKKQVVQLLEQAPVFWQKLRLYGEQLKSKFPEAERLLPSLSDPSVWAGRIAGFVEASSGKIVSLISNSFLIPVIVFYLLRDREKIKRMSLYVLPGKWRTPAMYLFRDINRQLRDYLSGQGMIVLIVSALMALLLLVFGFEYWLLLGLIMGIFNVIPYIGPLLGSVPILLTALPRGWNHLMLALILILVVQQIDNLLIHPYIVSGSVQVHPVAVLLCVIAGNSLAGAVGMLMAIPVFIVLRILFREFYRYFTKNRRNFLKLKKI